LDDVGQETFAVAMIVQWVDDIGLENLDVMHRLSKMRHTFANLLQI